MSHPPDQSERDRATDIHRSVIVQAPAGSGKTSLLVRRYLRLLSVVERPEEVLAITFTRKAASEMANRVLDALQAAASDRSDVSMPEAVHALSRSREKGWRLLEQPARLKIQTIDSLAMAMTRGLPVAAGLEANLALTESADALYREAAGRHLMKLYDNGPLTGEIADFLAQCGNDAGRAERLLVGMLGKRDQWLDVALSVVATHREAPERVAEVLEAAIAVLSRTVIDEFRDSIGETACAELDGLLAHAAAELGRDVTVETDRYRLLADILTTQRGDFRRQVTRREGFTPQFPEQKARVTALIETLRERDLAEQVVNLRYLPDPGLSAEAVQRLVNVSINLALAASELNTTFAASGFTDFTTLILNAQAALGDAQSPTELALALDYRIRHLLVDEFQDTSVSQFRLLERLVSGWEPDDGNTFFAVGDPMQSIYRFRDADVSLFYRAWRQGIGDVALERVLLSSNFRADARLVRWLNGTFSRILGSAQDPVLGRIAYRPATPTRDAQDAQPAVTLFRHTDPETQVRSTADHIAALLAETDGTIAVLVRNRRHLKMLIRTLRERGIRWHANDIDPLLDKPVVRDLLTLTTVLADPRDRLAWFSLLRAPFVGLSLTDLHDLADTADFPALLDAIDRGQGPALTDSARGRLARLAAAWRHCATLLHELPPRSVIETLWVRLGGTDAYADPGALLHATRILELMESLGLRALSPEALAQAAASLFAEDLTESRLQILTIHKAKGLEFDHVLIPFLERTPRTDDPELLLWRALPEGLLMGVKDDEGPYEWLARENRLRDRHERQRLLYVACTRARRSLALFAVNEARPRDTSLLALLAPLQDGDTAELQVVDVATETVTSEARQGDLFDSLDETTEPPRFSRLVDGYRYTPEESWALPVQTPQRMTDEDPLAAREEVLIGIVVHAALERLARTALPTDAAAFLAAQEPFWRREAERHALADGQRLSAPVAARLGAEIARQIRGVLADPQGRWLLEARSDAYAEFALTVALEGMTENLVVDRTFVEDGRRWVVDYKTSIPPAETDVEAFLDAETARYRLQLERYGDAVEALFGDRPDLALYFTALPRLRVLRGGPPHPEQDG
ncbi:MAG: UvrD-helicase domain-containing protein [Pseudomonadales bacterium]